MSLALAVARFDPYLFTGGDNAHYYALARALANGRGYVDLVAPGAPPHTLYPPGFPLLLVPLYLVSGGSMAALQLVSLIGAAALLWAIYRLARRDPSIPPWAAAAVVWMVGLYPAFQLYAHRLLSDMTYVALVVLALATVQGRTTEGGDADRVDRAWIVGCALALAAFYVRTAGVTLMAALVGWALWRRHWRRAAVTAGVGAAGAAPWFAWTRWAAPVPGGYLADLGLANPVSGRNGAIGELVERLRDVAVEYGGYQLPQLFWPSDPPPDVIRWVALTAGGGLLLWGAVRVLRMRGVTPADLYVAATLGLLFFWPWLGDRYFLTLAPVLWLYLLAGLDGASYRLGRRPTLGVLAAAAVGCVLLAGAGVEASRQSDRTRAWLGGDEFGGYSPFWADYFRAARWIGENSPENAVILARKPTLAWYWSGRPAVVPPRGRDPERRWRAIRRTGATHILLEPSTEAALQDVLHPRANELVVVHQTPRREVVVLSLPPEAALP